MLWTPRKFVKNLPIDAFGRRTHFIDHMAPVWNAIKPRYRGLFYVPEVLRSYARKRNIPDESLAPLSCRSDKPTSCQEPPFGRNPMLTSAYGDLLIVSRYDERPLILMEHGVGLTFNDKTGKTNSGYGGGEGSRAYVNLFLAPNEYIASKTKATYPDAAQVVIGTPKLDPWQGKMREFTSTSLEEPTVCISFHWDGSGLAPEAGNAWEHYRRFLPDLAKHYKLVGHGHPKIIDRLRFSYQKYGISVISDFNEVMEVADVYVNDASSTMYEFLVTGKPVVVLNAPWFRRWVHHGMRFWDYSEAGPVCEGPDDLITSINTALFDTRAAFNKRMQYVKELYPHLGYSAKVAAKAIVDHFFDEDF